MDASHLASFPRLNPNPVLEIDFSGKITFFNPATLKILEKIGYAETDVDVFIPADLQEVLGNWNRKDDSTLYREIELKERLFGETIFLTGQFETARIYAYDITERRQAELELRESEQRVRLKLESILTPEGEIGSLDLADIIDARALQSLVDDFYELTGMPMGLIDIEGKILVGVGWKEICTRFHRIHPETRKNCLESDVQLSAGIPPGEYKVYKCRNNLWDVATPVMIGDRQFGNLFMGQFFFEDEPLDYELFRAQARQYGFDEKEYIAALDAAPRLSRKILHTSMNFFMKLADIISKLSYSNLKLARSLAERDALMESLRQSEERLNWAQEISHLGSWEFDLVKNRLSWSNEVYRIFGLQPQEFAATYEAFLEAVHPDDRAAIDAAYICSLKEGRDTYEIEHRVVRNTSGEVRIVLEKCEHFRDVAGQITRSIGMVHDITERKRAENALQESELFYRQTLESIPGMVFTTRPDGYCDFQSQQWVDFTGVPRVEHLGDGWNKLLHPDDRPRAYSAWLAAVEERAPYDLEYRIRRHDGLYEWFKVRGRPIRDAAGEIVRWFGTAMNIDHLIKAEEELRQARDEWELTFNSVPDLIAILDDRHQVVRVNRAMAERLGRKSEECKGMTCYEAIHGSSLPSEFCPHSRTMNDGREHTVELRAERLEADYLVSTTPLLDSQGRMTGTVHVARDITERKRVEEELRRARDAAQAATRAKSQFLANMSHELRTPMTGVLGMLDLVLSGNLDAEQKEYIEIAQSSASSLVRILNDILDLTKIESGTYTIEEKPFALWKCVEDTVNLLLPSAIRKGLDLRFTVADNVPATVVGDQLRLSQVLTNLVGNSVKFTAAGRVAIHVTAGNRTADDTREVILTVADTGIGIPADKQHLLFRSFSQVDDSHSRIYGGTGLGLAISKEIVERMRGVLTFASEEGKGSTFSCTIPFRETKEAHFAIEPEKAATDVGTACAAGTAKPRLLVAEDDATIRQVLGLMLQKSNLDIDLAGSGVEVVEKWENGQFDLILMDVQMPGMNGFEATAVIREKERSRGGHTPIIAMTAHALKEDEERCLSAGMDSYISKPIDFKKSLQIIEDILRQKP